MQILYYNVFICWKSTPNCARVNFGDIFFSHFTAFFRPVEEMRVVFSFKESGGNLVGKNIISPSCSHDNPGRYVPRDTLWNIFPGLNSVFSPLLCVDLAGNYCTAQRATLGGVLADWPPLGLQRLTPPTNIFLSPRRAAPRPPTSQDT